MNSEHEGIRALKEIGILLCVICELKNFRNLGGRTEHNIQEQKQHENKKKISQQ